MFRKRLLGVTLALSILLSSFVPTFVQASAKLELTYKYLVVVFVELDGTKKSWVRLVSDCNSPFLHNLVRKMIIVKITKGEWIDGSYVCGEIKSHLIGQDS